MDDITHHLVAAHKRIDRAALAAKRSSTDIQLLAVSKTKPVEAVRAAIAAGQRRFGESYVQEAVEKIRQIEDEVEWHFIGPIQSNKTRLIAEHFDWVQSVDREKIAQRLNEQRPSHLTPLNICIQVNISDEAQKAGISPEQLPKLAEFVATQSNLCLRGLMAIPANTSVPEQQRAQFTQLKQLFIQLKSEYPSMDTLSMGMTNDMEAAITEGATMVRLGTAIFGARDIGTGNRHR